MINEIEYVSSTGRVILRDGTSVKHSLPGDVFLTKSTKQQDEFVLSHSMLMQEFSKGLHIKYGNIDSLKIDSVPQAIPGDIDSLMELLSASFFLVTNPLISSNESRITTLEDQLLKVTNFEIISGATGAITIPTNGTILLDQFEGVVDAIVSEIDGSNTPTWVSPRTIGGTVITVTSFDVGGNYVLSGTPTGNISIIYVYSVARKDFDLTNSIGFETLDLTAEEIEAGYNNQVDIVTQLEAEAGTLSVVRRWTPERIKQAIDALAGSSDTYQVKVSSSDTTPKFLGSKILSSNDIVINFNNPFGDENLTIDAQNNIKPIITNVDPTVNDDLTVGGGLTHRLGQLWLNTANNKRWICRSLSIGGAFWDPMEKIVIDGTDDTAGFLEDKLLVSTDLFTLKTVNPNKKLSFNVRDSMKAIFTNSDPTVNDDITVLDNLLGNQQPLYKPGQIWVNQATNKVFVNIILTAGAAVWLPINTTLDSLLLSRANHTGTQTASTISDFDTEVSNNTDVTANTAKLSSLKTKSGTAISTAFAGNPKKVTITFSTAFADANYSPVLTCNTTNGNAYTPIVENITASSFDINMTVNNIGDLTDVRWVAIKQGEN